MAKAPELFPLDGCGQLPQHVGHDARHVSNVIHYTQADFFEQFIGQRGPRQLHESVSCIVLSAINGATSVKDPYPTR